MARPIRPTQLSKVINKLIFAKRFLVLAALLQVGSFLLPLNIRSHIYGYAWILSSLFAIIGFLIAYDVLDLKREAQDESIILLGPRLQVGLIFFFIMAFFVPLVNLTIMVWAYVKSASAVRRLKQLRSDVIAEEKQRANLRSEKASVLEDIPWKAL